MRGETAGRVGAGDWLLLAAAAFVAAALALAVCGCRSESTGVSAAVGDITTLPEISDASDNVSVKILYKMTGARLWSAKDANVRLEYRNCYTNDYMGVFHTRGLQDFAVVVEPVESQGNAATATAAADLSCAQGASPASSASPEPSQTD